ncbi:uncharacterized protein O3C94_016667 isoform 2-T2 [Discoglossus pictus]
MDKKTTIERILTHVLEIIYLLTGEHLNIPLMTNKMHQDLKPMNKLIMNYAMEIIYLLIGQKDTFVMNSPHSHHLTGEVPLQPAGVAVSYPVMEKSKLLEGPQEIVVESHQIRSSGGDIADVVSNAQQTADLCVRSLLEAPEQDICGISSGLNDEIIYTVSIKEEGEDETQEKDTEQVEIQQDLGAGLHDEYLHTASTKEESGENKEEKDTEQVQIHTETSAGLCTVKEEEEERDISPVEIHPNLGAGSNDEKPYHVSIKEELEEEIKKDRNHDKELGTGLTEPSDDNLYSASIKEEAEEETEEINIQQVDIRPDLGAGLHNDNRNPVLINVEGEYERDRKAIWPVDINSVISKVLSSKVDGPKSRDLLKESYPAVPAPVAMGAHTSMFQVTTPGPSTSCVNELTRNKASTSQQTSVQRKRHRCNECGKMFDYKSLLNRHQIIHSVEKPYKCNECGKRYAYKHVLVTHQKMHTGDLPYSCNECRKNFAKKSHLRAHAISHREDRNFRCSECGKEFACERYLIIHQRIHTYVKSYRCNACGKLFACRRYLTIHKKSHATELPHKCDVCGKRFVYNYHLIKHQRSHTGEKPYMCSQCGKHFIDKYNLAAHHKTHMGVKPYRCNECGTDYATKSSLTRHKKSHTGETQEL